MQTYRIETDRLVIRCWEPSDAVLLKEAIDCSIDHLLPWMPWAKGEPQTIEEKIELLRLFRGNYDLGKDFVLGVFNRDGSRVLGGSGMHTRQGPNEREIGYWVRADEGGRGIITEAVRAIARVAFEIEGIDRLEIRCDPENLASRRVAEKSGFSLDAELPRRRLPGEEVLRNTLVYSRWPEGIDDENDLSAIYRAFDAMGRELSPGISRSGEPTEDTPGSRQ